MTNLLRTSKRSKMQISNVRLDKVSTINEQNWAALTKKQTHIQFAYIFATSTAYPCMSFSALLFLLQLRLSDLFVCVHKIILLHILWRDKWYFGDFHAETYVYHKVWICAILLLTVSNCFESEHVPAFCRLPNGNLIRKLKFQIPLHMRSLNISFLVPMFVISVPSPNVPYANSI